MLLADHELKVLPLGRRPELRSPFVVDGLTRPGAALFDGWHEEAGWRTILPWPSEVRRLDWEEAEQWPQFVESLPASPHPPDPFPEAPFLRGWAGFISYEAGAATEGAAAPPALPPEPAACFARHESGIFLTPDDEAFLFGKGDLAHLVDAISIFTIVPQREGMPVAGIDDSFDRASWTAAVDSIREAIAAGDVYQVNLTRALRARRWRSDGVWYEALAGPLPPARAAYLRGEEWSIVSASPEVLLDFDRQHGEARSRPIKGTARKSDDRVADQLALLSSAKDAAEHLMIVDLVRNDLGKVAPAGRVDVRSYRTLLELPYAFHLESTICASGLEGKSAAEVLSALFPGGSITGAPKRAAVGMIRGIEPVPRGVYTGSIGLIDDRGSARFSVAIRTAVLTAGEVRYHAGGGIVWESEAAAEDEESRVKAAPFFSLLRGGR